MNKKILALIVCLLMSLASVARAETAVTSNSTDTSFKSVKNTALLFVLFAKEGTITKLTDNPNDFQLILNKVSSRVVYFSERPIRKSGQAGLQDFLAEWYAGSFHDNPPNAVIQAVKLGSKMQPIKKEVNYAVVLMNPVYHKANNSLTFDIKGLSGNKINIINKENADYIALFIDGICFSCVH